MKCKNCGAQIPDAAESCPECGGAIAAAETSADELHENDSAFADIEDFSSGEDAEESEPWADPATTIFEKYDENFEARFAVAQADAAHAAAAPHAAAAMAAVQIAEDERKKRVRRTIGICIVAVIALAVVIATMLYVNHRNELEEERTHSLHAVTLSLTLEGYVAADDCRIPVEVSGYDFEGNQVDELFYVNADGSGIELVSGEYNVTFPSVPLTSTSVFFIAPTDTFPLSIPSNLDTGEAAPAESTVTAIYGVLPFASVTSQDVQQAYAYALRDSDYVDRAEANKTAWDTRISDYAASTEHAAKKAEFTASLDEIDQRLITTFTEKNSAGTYNISTAGVLVTTANSYRSEYRTLESTVKAYVEDEYPDTYSTVAEIEPSSTTWTTLISGGGKVADALKLHITYTGSETGDEATARDFAMQVLSTRQLVVDYINLMV